MGDFGRRFGGSTSLIKLQNNPSIQCPRRRPTRAYARSNKDELTLMNKPSIWVELLGSPFSSAAPPLGFPNAASKSSLYRFSEVVSTFSTPPSQLRFEHVREWTRPYRSANRRMSSSTLDDSAEPAEEARIFDHRSSRSEWIGESGSDNSNPAAASQTHNNWVANPSER